MDLLCSLCFNDWGVASLSTLTSRVMINLIVQVVHIVRPMVWTGNTEIKFNIYVHAKKMWLRYWSNLCKNAFLQNVHTYIDVRVN